MTDKIKAELIIDRATWRALKCLKRQKIAKKPQKAQQKPRALFETLSEPQKRQAIDVGRLALRLRAAPLVRRGLA
jgi:ribosomal protein S21